MRLKELPDMALRHVLSTVMKEFDGQTATPFVLREVES